MNIAKGQYVRHKISKQFELGIVKNTASSLVYVYYFHPIGAWLWEWSENLEVIDDEEAALYVLKSIGSDPAG